jgi:hypothetical protein
MDANSSNLKVISPGRGQRNYDPQNLPAESEKRFGRRYVRYHSWRVSNRFVPLPASRMRSPTWVQKYPSFEQRLQRAARWRWSLSIDADRKEIPGVREHILGTPACPEGHQ